MNSEKTKNAALTTALAFHYQALIGLLQCFSLEDGQSIWFERDGDVSLIGESVNESIQTEVKNYAAPLTDHHENFWKTLKNWLSPEFNHEHYRSLVLLTTQKFGANSTLKNWNEKNVEQRIAILECIFNTRKPEELIAEEPKNIVQIQNAVFKTEREKLKNVVAKIVLTTDVGDEQVLRAQVFSHLSGIPGTNKGAYMQGLVGFVYDNANPDAWEIKKSHFDAKCIELTSTYCRKKFTFPPFKGIEATEEQIDLYEHLLFVKKIYEIEHHDVIPDAIGNWIELQNSLLEQLDEYPMFADETKKYQNQLIKNLKLKYSTAKLNCTSQLRDSKVFYNQTIGDTPLNMGSDIPPIEYRNGLIHDAMDNQALNLQWKVEP